MLLYVRLGNPNIKVAGPNGIDIIDRTAGRGPNSAMQRLFLVDLGLLHHPANGIANHKINAGRATSADRHEAFGSHLPAPGSVRPPMPIASTKMARALVFDLFQDCHCVLRIVWNPAHGRIEGLNSSIKPLLVGIISAD